MDPVITCQAVQANHNLQLKQDVSYRTVSWGTKFQIVADMILYGLNARRRKLFAKLFMDLLLTAFPSRMFQISATRDVSLGRGTHGPAASFLFIFPFAALLLDAWQCSTITYPLIWYNVLQRDGHGCFYSSYKLLQHARQSFPPDCEKTKALVELNSVFLLPLRCDVLLCTVIHNYHTGIVLHSITVLVPFQKYEINFLLI